MTLNWLLYYFGVLMIVSIASFGVLWLCICLIPSDFFFRSGNRPHGRSVATHRAWVITRNFVGVLFLLVGAFYLVAPGPGVPWILLGFGLMDLPGKHRIILKMTRMESVRKCLNWLRKRGGREPLQFPESLQDLHDHDALHCVQSTSPAEPTTSSLAENAETEISDSDQSTVSIVNSADKDEYSGREQG